MFEVCVWSNKQAAVSSLFKTLIDKKLPLTDDIVFDCDSLESFKLTTVLKNYAVKRSDLAAKAKDIKVRVALSDSSDDSASAMLCAATVAKNNPVSTEQYVFAAVHAAEKTDIVKFTGYTPHIVLEKIARPGSIIDKSPVKYESVCQIHASPLKAFLTAASGILDEKSASLRYIDALTDPDTSTGIAAIALTGYTTLSEDDEGDTVSGGAAAPVIIVGFFAAKFNMDSNPLIGMLPAPGITTAMNRGLKNKIKLLSRMGSETRLACYITEELMNGKSFNVDIQATDKDGNLLKSNISVSKLDSQSESIAAAFDKREILLDSTMLETVMGMCRGDLRIGLSVNRISLISDDAIVHTATKIVKEANSAAEPVAPAPSSAASPVAAASSSASIEDALSEGFEIDSSSLNNGELKVSTDNSPADNIMLMAADSLVDNLIGPGDGPNKCEETDTLRCTKEYSATSSAGKGLITNESDHLKIVISQFENINGVLTFRDGANKVEVTIASAVLDKDDADNLMPTRSGNITPIKFKKYTIKGKILSAMARYRNTNMSLLSLIEASNGDLDNTSHGSMLACIAVLCKEGYLLKVARGLYKLDPAAEFEVIE